MLDLIQDWLAEHGIGQYAPPRRRGRHAEAPVMDPVSVFGMVLLLAFWAAVFLVAAAVFAGGLGLLIWAAASARG